MFVVFTQFTLAHQYTMCHMAKIRLNERNINFKASTSIFSIYGKDNYKNKIVEILRTFVTCADYYCNKTIDKSSFFPKFAEIYKQ